MIYAFTLKLIFRILKNNFSFYTSTLVQNSLKYNKSLSAIKVHNERYQLFRVHSAFMLVGTGHEQHPDICSDAPTKNWYLKTIIALISRKTIKEQNSSYKIFLLLKISFRHYAIESLKKSHLCCLNGCRFIIQLKRLHYWGIHQRNIRKRYYIFPVKSLINFLGHNLFPYWHLLFSYGKCDSEHL